MSQAWGDQSVGLGAVAYPDSLTAEGYHYSTDIASFFPLFTPRVCLGCGLFHGRRLRLFGYVCSAAHPVPTGRSTAFPAWKLMPRYPASFARTLQWGWQQLFGAFCDYTLVTGFVIFHRGGTLCALLCFAYFFATPAIYTTGIVFHCENPTRHSLPSA